MESIKIKDHLFSHWKYSTDIQESIYINWNREPITDNDTIAIYTDSSLEEVNPTVQLKIAWLLESPAITDIQHEWIKYNYHKFDYVYTHDRNSLELDSKFKFVPVCGCWIHPTEQQIYSKTKLLSMISSNKDWTDGHKLRKSVINNVKNIDLYGRGYNEIKSKLTGLKDYMFSIVIENTKKDYYFSEKLIDCFVTGTIPIYWGCPSIGDFFDERGDITSRKPLQGTTPQGTTPEGITPQATWATPLA